MLEETIKYSIYRHINKFGYDEKRLSDSFKDIVNNKNKFDNIVGDVLSDLKQFNNIVESLPRICPIIDVLNYDFNNEKDWDFFHLQEVNYKIDKFNEKYFNLKYDEEHYDGPPIMQHPEIYKYSVWVIADFGEKDNKYYDDFIIHNNRSKKLIPQDMREKLEKENDEFLRSRLLICDIREQYFLENYFLYGYTKRLSRDEFICRFNKGLYEYVNNKIQLVKTQGRPAKSSKWQEVLDEILDWFVEKNINYKDVKPLLEMKISQGDPKKPNKPKGKGGRPRDPKLEEKKQRLSKEYYRLTKKDGYKSSEAIKTLSEKYKWKKSTIKTYLK